MTALHVVPRDSTDLIRELQRVQIDKSRDLSIYLEFKGSKLVAKFC